MPHAFFALGLFLMTPFVAVSSNQSNNAFFANFAPQPAVATMGLTLPTILAQAADPGAAANTNTDAAQTARPLLDTVKAYYVGYSDDSFEAVKQYVPAVDIVAGQWLSVDSNGKLTEARDTARNEQVRQLVHNAGKKVYSCVVNEGFSRKVLDSVLLSPTLRTRVIDRIIEFVNAKGEDGVDLDFEGIRASHGDGYSAFAQELGQKLHAQGKELSIAVDATFTGEPGPGIDYKALSKNADSVMPMSYTYGPGRAPIAPISYLANHARGSMKYMDPSKFMIGIGVYARDYNLNTGQRKQPNNAVIAGLLDQYKPEVKLDPETLTKAFKYTDAQGNPHRVYYDDAETLRQKLTRLSTRYGVRSVGFWRMGQEDPQLWNFIADASGKQAQAAGMESAQPSGN